MPPIPPGRATDWLVGAATIIWLLATLSGNNDYIAAIAGFIPARWGGVLELEGGVPALLTPFTSAFLHAGLLHLGFNMLTLFYCGRYVEQVIGGPLLILLYLFGCLGAALGQYLPDPGSVIPTIGASGALSAIVAAYAIFYGKAGTRAVGPLSAHAVRILWLAAAWIGVQTLVGIAASGGMMQIAIGAHIGGFLTGLILARPMLMWRYRRA